MDYTLHGLYDADQSNVGLLFNRPSIIGIYREVIALRISLETYTCQTIDIRSDSTIVPMQETWNCLYRSIRDRRRHGGLYQIPLLEILREAVGDLSETVEHFVLNSYNRSYYRYFELKIRTPCDEPQINYRGLGRFTLGNI